MSFPCSDGRRALSARVGCGRGHVGMRPELLNPLFAPVEALKGIGPTLAKPLAKLGISRVVDLLFHLPIGMIERRRIDRLDMVDAGCGVIVTLTAQGYKGSSSARGPFRV